MKEKGSVESFVDALWSGSESWEELTKGWTVLERIQARLDACEGYAKKCFEEASTRTWGERVFRHGSLAFAAGGLPIYFLTRSAQIRVESSSEGTEHIESGRSALVSLCALGPSGQKLLNGGSTGPLYPAQRNRRILNGSIIEDALSGVFSPDMSRKDERYLDAQTCLEDGLAMSEYFGQPPAGAAPLPYVLGVGGGKHLLTDLARQVVGRYSLVEAQAEEFWVGLMRMEPSGPVGREIVAALRASAADLALDILGETGDARVARAILEEAGERAMEDIDHQGSRYAYANADVQERFNELLLDAHGRLRSARERLEIMAQMQSAVADEKSDMPRRRSGL